MPTMIVTPDENGVVTIGDFPMRVAQMLALVPSEATGKALKLQDGRIQFKARPEGADHDVTYTVALSVQREPLNEEESRKIEAKAAEQKLRKDQKAADDQTVRDREIRRAIAMTKETVLDVVRDAQRGRELATKLGI